MAQLEAAAALEDVNKLRHLLNTAASSIAGRYGAQLQRPDPVHLASMSPVPAAMECLVAAGASVLLENTTVSVWETTRAPAPVVSGT